MQRVLFVFSFLFLITSQIHAQSLIKEAMNSFALYGKKQKITDLENARKKIDALYTTKKDSNVYRNNLVRGLIYSTLAVVDVNRKYTYKKDPIEEATFSLRLLKNSKLNIKYEQELQYIRTQLAKAYLIKANKALEEGRNYDALSGYVLVNNLSSGNINVLHNLALLNERIGSIDKAIEYYNALTASESSHPDYFLGLANLYEQRGDYVNMLSTLQKGHKEFPRNRDIIFKLLNTYSEKADYKSVLSLINHALAIEEDNNNLYYLAGFAHEVTGSLDKAEFYYKKILEKSPDNYDANYALGLLYLNSFIINTKNDNSMFLAKQHLVKANEINPNDIKALRALNILYNETGDMLQLEKINNKLNELTLK
ncbi:MAG TPA: tetratricopeptide repeat protein [Sphingobacteriaceae bacterium]